MQAKWSLGFLNYPLCLLASLSYTEWQDLGSCLLPLRTDKKLGYFLSGGGDGKLVKRVPFLVENDLTAAKRIMG